MILLKILLLLKDGDKLQYVPEKSKNEENENLRGSKQTQNSISKQEGFFLWKSYRYIFILMLEALLFSV